jgi:hypothetical protein
MKIRKVFELVDYEEVDLWRPIGQYWKTNEMDSVEIKKLCKIFPQLRKPHENEKGFTVKTKLIYDSKDGRVDIDILKNDDEWFFVKVIKGDVLYGKTNYYKCDQFEGLIKLIKEKIIK